MGLSTNDTDNLSMGMVNDLFIEKVNDTLKYPYIATQADIDKL